MKDVIIKAIAKIEELSKNKPIKVISHNDTDGITSGAIFSRTLQRWNKNFSLEIVKNLEEEYIEKLSEDNLLIFLDLGSGSLPALAKKNTEIFILDHHELPDAKSIPKNITMINPTLMQSENISSAAICYLFACEISEQNKDLSNLAIIGMVGDMLEKSIGKTYKKIMKDAEVKLQKGLLLYPATRPLDKVLEYSFGLYIPNVTGSFKGALELLREAGIEKAHKGFKSLAELDDEEMSRLTTAVMLKKLNKKTSSDLIGNIFLVKFLNRQEDAREISALINACSRMDYPEVALGFCLGNKAIKKEAEKIYTKYRQSISAALKHVTEMDKITGKNYVIVNAKDKIKDTIIGTIASIMSFSPLYSKGTIIVTMAYSSSEKIKISTRLAGREGRNVREALSKAAHAITNEVGGHHNAAGCLIPIKKEQDFIENLKKVLEVEMIKV